MGMLSAKRKYEETKTRYGIRRRVTANIYGASLTKQSEAAACDINNIMKKYEKTGQLPLLAQKDPKYGDFSEVPDYLDAMNTISVANEQFASLNAKLRARFGNDPAEFLAFVTDDKNLPEMVKLGLATKRPPVAEQAPQKVVIVGDSSQKANSSPAQTTKQNQAKPEA